MNPGDGCAAAPYLGQRTLLQQGAAEKPAWIVLFGLTGAVGTARQVLADQANARFDAMVVFGGAARRGITVSLVHCAVGVQLVQGALNMLLQSSLGSALVASSPSIMTKSCAVWFGTQQPSPGRQLAPIPVVPLSSRRSPAGRAPINFSIFFCGLRS